MYEVQVELKKWMDKTNLVWHYSVFFIISFQRLSTYLIYIFFKNFIGTSSTEKNGASTSTVVEKPSGPVMQAQPPDMSFSFQTTDEDELHPIEQAESNGEEQTIACAVQKNTNELAGAAAADFFSVKSNDQTAMPRQGDLDAFSRPNVDSSGGRPTETNEHFERQAFDSNDQGGNLRQPSKPSPAGGSTGAIPRPGVETTKPSNEIGLGFDFMKPSPKSRSNQPNDLFKDQAKMNQADNLRDSSKPKKTGGTAAADSSDEAPKSSNEKSDDQQGFIFTEPLNITDIQENDDLQFGFFGQNMETAGDGGAEPGFFDANQPNQAFGTGVESSSSFRMNDGLSMTSNFGQVQSNISFGATYIAGDNDEMAISFGEFFDEQASQFKIHIFIT